MFIVFEGIDGCGKSTQIWKLAHYLSNLDKHTHLLITREPYKEKEIRRILRADDNSYGEKEKLTELFVKDRQEHVDELIKPALEKKIIVISDRYKYSTICYQAAQGQDVQKLIEMHKNMPVPDFVFVVDTTSDEAVERMKKDENMRTAAHKFEKNREFQEKVRQNYLKIKEIFPNEKIIILDGNKTIEEIFEEIKKCFNNI